ncbi:MAG: FG-GAP-like repeat-containing protein [Actinomycetota bacterium]|nr:FG-GAP-like repeat-containing protein [Actinomycetota bacterium]
MSLFRSRFVTACQQLLALGAVLAVLTPAASLISLDVVRQPPAGVTISGGGSGVGVLSAYARAARSSATLPATAVDPVVREVSLTGTAAARTVAGGGQRLVSRPEVVTGDGMVGVTWARGAEVAEEDLSIAVRTLTDGEWSGWSELEHHDEHAPDPDTREGRRSRPGTEPLYVGDVDRVQVRVVDTAGAAPADLRLAVIDPGTPTRTVSQRAALDTAETTSATGPAARGGVTPEPQIFSRAQWGADESMRDKGSLRYYEVHAGFVHHTVNANDYSRDEVPGILRSIYAYHTKSRGWSDVGYNFLVDRFGRIWEGRYGGVDRPVVGAHTLGYNDYAFAMSAIGNFEQVKPSQAMVEAYGALFAWKLSLHGVDASSTKQQVGSDTFPAINGHRDAGSTACPGKYLYARLDDIRSLATAAQTGWEGRDLDSDLLGTPHPDVVARRSSDHRVVVIPTGGLTKVRKPVVDSTGWGAYAATLVSPDLTGDGRPDLLGRTADGSVEVRVDGRVLRTVGATRGHDLLAAPGDVDGDGLGDLVGREEATGRPTLFRGRGNGGFAASAMTGDWSGYDLLAGVGDLDGDGVSDLVARDAAGALWLLPAGGAGSPSVLVQDGSRYDAVTGAADWNGDGLVDLVVRREGGHAYVLPGRGDGTVGAARGPVKRLKGRGDLSGAGDVTGSAAPDLVSRRGDEMLVFAGTGTFDTGAVVETNVRAKGADLVLNAGDWDGDGHGDLIVRQRRNGAVKVRTGDGAGSFAKAVKIGHDMGGVRMLEVVGDMTGDGWPDLMGQPSGGAMRIYPGRGLEPLGPSYQAHSALSGTRQLGVGRWDSDGAPDTLVRRGDDLLVYTGNGPGGLTGGRALSLDLADYDLMTGVSDVTLRNRPDLVVRERGTGRLLLVESRANGFKSPRVIADGAEAYDLVD